MGHVALNDRYALASSDWRQRLVEQDAFFAHLGSGPSFLIRKRLWNQLLLKWNKTQFLPPDEAENETDAQETRMDVVVDV